MAIVHGGQLHQVAKEFKIPEKEWIDLSTGIAPYSYPIPDIPLPSWQDLPSIPASLIEVSKRYYQAQFCWPLAGSQALIEKLPMLWLQKNNTTQKPIDKHVYLPRIGYKEHQQAWFSTGYQLHFYQKMLPVDIEKNSVVVVINPNNPLTDVFDVEQLKQLQITCEKQQSLLIIDEAFADIFPLEFSFVPHISYANVLVLRSFGKFFGLAGIRIGFVCSTQEWHSLIQNMTGPWSVNGPSLYIAEQALQDKNWQQIQKKRLQKQSKKMRAVLIRYFPEARVEANSLFITVFIDNAKDIYKQLCQQAVYVRLTDEKEALRFGISTAEQLIKLEAVFSSLTEC